MNEEASCVQQKREIIGSIFKEKIVFENGHYRTTSLNEMASLICQIFIYLKGKKKGQITAFLTYLKKWYRWDHYSAHLNGFKRVSTFCFYRCRLFWLDLVRFKEFPVIKKLYSKIEILILLKYLSLEILGFNIRNWNVSSASHQT